MTSCSTSGGHPRFPVPPSTKFTRLLQFGVLMGVGESFARQSVVHPTGGGGNEHRNGPLDASSVRRLLTDLRRNASAKNAADIVCLLGKMVIVSMCSCGRWVTSSGGCILGRLGDMPRQFHGLLSGSLHACPRFSKLQHIACGHWTPRISNGASSSLATSCLRCSSLHSPTLSTHQSTSTMTHEAEPPSLAYRISLAAFYRLLFSAIARPAGLKTIVCFAIGSVDSLPYIGVATLSSPPLPCWLSVLE